MPRLIDAEPLSQTLPVGLALHLLVLRSISS